MERRALMAGPGWSSGERPYRSVWGRGELSPRTHSEGVNDYHWPWSDALGLFLFLSSHTGEYKWSDSAGNLLLLLKTIFFRSEMRCKWLSFFRYPFKSDTSLKIARRGEGRSPNAPFWGGNLPSLTCGSIPGQAPLNTTGVGRSRRQRTETDHVNAGTTTLSLPSINANKLKILFCSIRIFVAIFLLHDGLQCTFIICTYCGK